MERIVCLVIGYVFGLFQTAYIYGRMKGIDIRKHGSGNAGTTNTLRVLGTKAGLIVFAGDVLKCVLAVVIVRLIFGKSHADKKQTVVPGYTDKTVRIGGKIMRIYQFKAVKQLE